MDESFSVAEDYNDFGNGKANTIRMINSWNDEEYGEQYHTDLWGAIQDGQFDIVTSENDTKKWFIPSQT